jgi:hypothetical protein
MESGADTLCVVECKLYCVEQFGVDIVDGARSKDSHLISKQAFQN